MWTDQVPTLAGWYWYVEHEYPAADRVPEIIYIIGDGTALFPRISTPLTLSNMTLLRPHFFGPLLPPKGT